MKLAGRLVEKEEREICREVLQPQVDVVRSILSERRYVMVEGVRFNRSRSKNVHLLCMMASLIGGKTATVHRLQFRVKNHQIRSRYSKKLLTPLKRTEGRLNVETLGRAFQILREMPRVKAVLVKESLMIDFECAPSRRKLRAKLDECRAINPCNPRVQSSPFTYLEVEDKTGVDPEVVREKSDLWNELGPFLSALRFPNLNKIRRCWEHFPGAMCDPASEVELGFFIERAFRYSGVYQ